MSYPYVGNYIYIRKEGAGDYQAFVSNYSGGSDDWYPVPNEFDDSGKWGRDGWELVAIRNMEDTHREGAYVSAKNATVYVTIKSITHLEIIRSPQPY